jgi:hypothetical protein
LNEIHAFIVLKAFRREVLPALDVPAIRPLSPGQNKAEDDQILLRGLVGEGNRIARRLLDLQSEISVSPEIKKYAVA